MPPTSSDAQLAQYVAPALAIVTGILGWLVKDFFFGIVSKRREIVRTEWKARLTEVWNPLYYWTGVVRMGDEKKGWERHGIKELEGLVKGNVHLIPPHHFYTLIRLVEHATGQSTSPVDEKGYRAARLFIYQRIEILNFLLYKQTREYDPDAYTDPLALPRTVLRGLTLVFVHGVVWALILVVPGLMYLAWMRQVRWIFWAAGALLAVGAAIEYRRRNAVHRAVLKALYPSETWTWKALLARMGRAVWPRSPLATEASAPALGDSGPSRLEAVVEVPRLPRAPGADARTVAEVFAQRNALRGKAVSIRGKVVKFNEGIMGRNWLHLRDGTGRPGKDNDLTVTTKEGSKVGDIVIVKGTVSVDKGFGAGYAYPVIIEDANIASSK